MKCIKQMSINNIKPSQFEIETRQEISPQKRLEEVAGEILLDCTAKWKTEIIDCLTNEEIKEYLALNSDIATCTISLEKEMKSALVSRRHFARATEVGMPYCVYHDCNMKDCPTGFHDD